MNINGFESSSIAAALSLSVEDEETFNQAQLIKPSPKREIVEKDYVHIPTIKEENPSYWQQIVNWFSIDTKKSESELSFWDKLVNWFSGEKIAADATVSGLDLENKPSPIPFIPALDPPEQVFDSSLINETPRKNLGIKMPIREIEEIVASLSGKTVQKIMNIIMEAQAELDKESAVVADSTFSLYNRFRKTKETTLEKIKDAILEDQNWAAKLKTPLQLTAAAVFICGSAAAAVTFGLVAPIGAGIGAIFGQAASLLFQSSTSALATVAPIVAAIFASFKGLSFYNELKLDSETTQLILTGHDEKFYNRLCDKTLENVASLSEREGFYQEWLAKFRERSRSLVSLLLQR